ncbi:MAG TPA: TVP38/TMEM64 family protein [Solirubrobacteraceae bacterium]|nr:TVP38/TMEM64 family protein [Solirubrobacteraceae bacterium]
MRAPGPRVRLALLVAGMASAFAILALSGSLSVARVQSWFQGLGWAGPVVFVLASSLLTAAMFPGPLLAGAAGLLFGTALGTPTSIAAATCGATLACLIGRRVAGDAVDELGGERVTALAALVARRGFASVLYARVAPLMPYNVVNYAAGLTAIPIATFTLATAIGVAPRAFAYAALGGSLGNFGSPESVIAVATLVAMAVGGLLVVRRDVLRERAARSMWTAQAPPPTAAPGARAAARGAGSERGSSSPACHSAAPR